MDPAFVAVIGVLCCGLGVWGIRDFRRWNGPRSGPITLSAFLATVCASLFFPPLALLGAGLAVGGVLRFLGR